jgi:hypothetical protein
MEKGQKKLRAGTHRVTFSFDKSSRTELFEELAENNKRLYDLLATSDRISAGRESVKVTRAKSAMNKSMTKFWRHANGLFCLIKNAFDCDCRTMHKVDLLLRHPSTPNIEFRTMFLFDREDAISTALPWIWKEVNIKMITEAKQPTTVSIQVPQRKHPHREKSPSLPSIKSGSSASKPQENIHTPRVTKSYVAEHFPSNCIIL